MDAKEEHWVAGVYIRESAISFVVGRVDVPPPEDWKNEINRIGGKIIPRTMERPPLKDFLYDSKKHETPQDFIIAGAEHLKTAVDRLGKALEVVHIACFGVYSDDGKLRHIGSYPEVWQEVNILAAFGDVLSPNGKGPRIELGSHTDAIAFGEYHFECSKRGAKPENYSLVSLDFSRTVSMSVVQNGHILRGAYAPMVSLIRPRRYTVDIGDGRTWFDLYQGNCDHHKDCIEGLIGVRALADRCDLRGEDFDKIPDDHPVWDVFVYYASQLCVTVTGILSPNGIVLTGRCIKQLYNEKFADRLVAGIQDAFYSRLSRSDGVLSPSYPDLEIREKFIRLPQSPVRKNTRLKGGMPGRHGAIRRAAAVVLDEMDRKQDA